MNFLNHLLYYDITPLEYFVYLKYCVSGIGKQEFVDDVLGAVEIRDGKGEEKNGMYLVNSILHRTISKLPSPDATELNHLALLKLSTRGLQLKSFLEENTAHVVLQILKRIVVLNEYQDCLTEERVFHMDDLRKIFKVSKEEMSHSDQNSFVHGIRQLFSHYLNVVTYYRAKPPPPQCSDSTQGKNSEMVKTINAMSDRTGPPLNVKADRWTPTTVTLYLLADRRIETKKDVEVGGMGPLTEDFAQKILNDPVFSRALGQLDKKTLKKKINSPIQRFVAGYACCKNYSNLLEFYRKLEVKYIIDLQETQRSHNDTLTSSVTEHLVPSTFVGNTPPRQLAV